MSYRLTIFPALEVTNKEVIFVFKTYEELRAAKDSCANLLLFLQDEAKAMNDYSNVFLQEELFNGCWEEMGEWEIEMIEKSRERTPGGANVFG